MPQLLRTDSQHADFRRLVSHLDAYLRVMDGEDHAFFAQFNQIESLQEVVVAYSDRQAVGCGAIKRYDAETAEVKRMYVDPQFRGQQIGTLILTELETWAGELGFSRCILETGKRQAEAIGLYQKNGYSRIPNYGQYENVALSVCFEKQIVSK